MRRIAAEGKIPIEKVRPAIPEVLRSDGTSNWCDPVLSINAMIARPTKFMDEEVSATCSSMGANDGDFLGTTELDMMMSGTGGFERFINS